MTWKPFHFLVVAISVWMNREQQQAIEYLRTENQVLREKLGPERIILNEFQNQRPAAAAIKLGKDLLRQLGALFSPTPQLKWHRWLVGRKHDGADGHVCHIRGRENARPAPTPTAASQRPTMEQELWTVMEHRDAHRNEQTRSDQAGHGGHRVGSSG